MIDFTKDKLTFNEAKKIIDDFDQESETEFDDRIKHWANFDVYGYDPLYNNIRNEVVSLFQQTLKDDDNKITYNLDLSVGIKLYELLNTETGFDIIAANDDDVWRYMSVMVFPDLTFIRYPNRNEDVDIIREYISGITYTRGNIKPEKDSFRIRKKRFYSHTRRIWVKTLWWYIYLGWQGSSEETYKVLQNNGTNIISHFIERPGRGYRKDLFRSMLYAYSLLPEQKDVIFRAAAKLNLAKCVSVEPALTDGGEIEYSKKLFEEVYTKEKENGEAERTDSEELDD